MNIVWFRNNYHLLILLILLIVVIFLMYESIYKNYKTNDVPDIIKEETILSKEECKIQPLDIKVMLPDNYIKEEVQPIVYNITINNYSNTSNSKTSKVVPKEVLLDTKDLQISIKK